MNNGRMWTVLSPNVGIPFFFVALVTASLSIHFSVLTSTDWFDNFFMGKKLADTSAQGAIQTDGDAIPVKVD